MTRKIVQDNRLPRSAPRRSFALAASLGALLAGALFAPPHARSHGPAHDKADARGTSKPNETVTSFGRSISVTGKHRRIEVDMTDDMRFTPSEIRVRQGERIELVVRNSGKILHELILGTRVELEKHAELMRKFPNMEHDDPYMVHVNPGKKASIHWHFTKVGEFMYGCLIPGHFEQGMVGKLVVTR
ncbi:MAG: cupredoxin family protein [Burkholderiaceae bacterium]|nr:cupredoxin family protein [Burkholderiaceae bacterium]